MGATTDEQQALRNLRQNNDAVILEADKWSAVVAMSRELYIAKDYRQLSDTDVFQQVPISVCFYLLCLPNRPQSSDRTG